MEKYYQRMLKDANERVVRALQRQILDENSSRYGGFADGNGMVQAKNSIYEVAAMAVAYCNEDSHYYHDEVVLERILLGLKYVRSVQHDNGLFDYITCNFFSAPDTAFCVVKLIMPYLYLSNKYNADTVAGIIPEQGNPAGEIAIWKAMHGIIRKGCFGLLEGGFHTPNHRWAIAALLMQGAKFFDSEEMRVAANTYLNEGIDGNEDGEYAEKSAGNYNGVNNNAMIALADATGDDSYDQYVVRNLRMMLTYWEPDDSIFTANSTRFDKDRLVYPVNYYMQYLLMGVKYNIPEFLQMCNRILEIVEEKHIESSDDIIGFMIKPELRTFEFEGVYTTPDYRAFYKDSGIARSRVGRYTYTVMNGKSNFFYIHNGTMKMEMKVAGSFCEHRAFKSQQMERISEKEYHLSQTMRGWYYLPFKEKPATSDWWKMDNASRKLKLGPDMQIDVWVKEVEHGVDVRVKTSGVEGAPWRIELAFSGVNFLTNEFIDMPLSGSEVLVMKQGYTEVSNGQDSLIVGPCFGEHHFTEGKEDSEAKTAGAATLYLTAYTGFDRVIEIRNKRSFYK
ncbi:MAG: hypothetical protein IJW63_02325 [Lachnospiraceae bacterium]|nr:hypothetical protein [Lachnospiraceae bacterium]